MSGPHECPECQRVFRWGKDDDSHLAVAAANESCAENAHWKLRGHMQAEHPDAGFLCPRRGEGSHQPDGKDWWGKRDGRRACGYCGSVHPDDLFAAIEAGTEITPTDKGYKIYVGGSGKFYFQHLDQAGRDRFIELYNSRAMKLAFPGRFYVTPYFARAAANDAEAV